MNIKYPNKIKYLRQQRGLTQQRVGQAFKEQKDITIISRWERGVVRPSAMNLIELCQILNVGDPSELYSPDSSQTCLDSNREDGR